MFASDSSGWLTDFWKDIVTGDKVEKSKMVLAELSDLQVAGKVRMLMRGDLDHEMVCTAARDRIMYLSQQVEYWKNVVECAAVAPTKTEACTIVENAIEANS